MKRNIIIFIFGAIAVIVLDQRTKAAIMAKFSVHESYAIIDGFFNLFYVMNPGAAFSFLADAPETFRYFFFIGITLLAMLLIIYYILKSKQERLSVIISLTLIFGGAVGNLIDRIRFRKVVDFLDVYLGFTDLPHWPTFNVADSAITVGALLMVWEMLVNRKKTSSS